ncbi:MAG: precorrin-6A reductase [Bacillota bacterium]|nr:precorrin-6A reductase [Bacillota bacterium]
MILLMGGTKDARMLAAALHRAFPREMIVATAVSDYGADLLREQGGCIVLQGAMDAAALGRFIKEKEVRVLVDATHPYAEQASAQAVRAAKEANIHYLRYERPSTEVPAGNGVYYAPDFKAAAVIAARHGDTLFLTIGTRHLQEFLENLPPGKNVIARILPDEAGFGLCRRLGLSPAAVVALQGPVSQRLNTALFAEYGAEVVVSKESGEAGGTPQKVAAAKELKIPIVLVRRPAGQDGLSTPAEVISALRKLEN